jgi:threonine/homoserine/homoserine lactone efflux protein
MDSSGCQLLPVGLIMGLAIAFPLGGSGAFCLSRTLTAGFKAGLVASLGIALAGAFYAAIGGFQLTFISDYFPLWEVWLRGCSGLFLCYLGVVTFMSASRFLTFLSGISGMAGLLILMFLLTLGSPLTVIPFTAAFPGFGLIKIFGSMLPAAALISGVFIGANLWWLILSAVVRLFHLELSPGALRWANRFFGIFIVITGLLAIVSLFPLL